MGNEEKFWGDLIELCVNSSYNSSSYAEFTVTLTIRVETFFEFIIFSESFSMWNIACLWKRFMNVLFVSWNFDIFFPRKYWKLETIYSRSLNFRTKYRIFIAFVVVASEACMSYFHGSTDVTIHSTTPLERTPTSFFDNICLRSETSGNYEHFTEI